MRPEVEPLQLAMERGAADAQRLGCRRYIALGAQQRALQDAALDVASGRPSRSSSALRLRSPQKGPSRSIIRARRLQIAPHSSGRQSAIEVCR